MSLKPKPPLKSRRRAWARAPAGRTALVAGALLLPAVLALVRPAAAVAHGPVNPAASSNQARIATTPAGTVAQVIDGDQRMWFSVDRPETLVVLDYRGAPYLRFTPAGVQVNQNSSMYYLNQVPAQTPPASLSSATPPRWSRVSSGRTYNWHDGRLHALASTARAPGATYLGRWTIPLRVNGAAAAIGGGLYYAAGPSIVWFWPIVVVVSCVLALLRLRQDELEVRAARGLAGAAVVAFVLAGAGQQLHGRPSVSAGQLIVLALVLMFAGWALRRLLLGRHGWFTFFLIAVAAIWEGASQITVLLDGFVLLALPPFLARAAVATCLAAGVGLLPLVFRMAERPIGAGRAKAEGLQDELDSEDKRTWELDV